jgi:hypothetical protein
MKTIAVEAVHGNGRVVNVRIGADGRISRKQYAAALQRLGAPVGDGLRLAHPKLYEPRLSIVVKDGETLWGLLS